MRHNRWVRTLTLVVVALLGALPLVACEDEPPPPERLEMTWAEHPLPAHPGPPGRTVVRDAVECGEGWWVAGAVFLDRPTETRDTRPALWFSPDRERWEPVPIEAGTYWGRRAILNSIACSRGRIAAVGARSGGAHGNPRVTTFFEKGGGLDDRRAPFNLYGGATATNVGPITGGDPGWLVTGNRITGPAVWHSADGRDFTIEEDVPGLADEDGFGSLAQAAAWDGRQWVVVGGGNEAGTLDRQPLEWTSPDGRTWERAEVPGTDGFDDLERVLPTDDGLVALGLRGDGFGAWLRDDDGWEAASDFGSIPDDSRSSPFVATLASGPRGLWATTSDGSAYALWHSDDGDEWAEVRLPATAPATAGEHVLAVAAHDEELVLLADDGEGGRVWWSQD
jgi:hypothetical protein